MKNVNEETVTDRIIQIIDWSKLSRAAFARKIGINRANIDNILKPKSINPSLELIKRICLAYPEINANWLVCNRGKMLQNEDEDKVVKLEDENNRLIILNAECSGQVTMLRAFLKDKEEQLREAYLKMQELSKTLGGGK